jgi:hypothetical protein
MHPRKGIRKIARQHPARDKIPVDSQSGYITPPNKGSKKGNGKRIPEINDIEAALLSFSNIDVMPIARKNIKTAPPNINTASSIRGA